MIVSGRIGLIGDSGGAYLSALVALAGDGPVFAGAYKNDPCASVSTKVKVCAGIYGVYDLAAQWMHDQLARPTDHVIQKFLGVPLFDNRRLFFEASPLSYAIRANNQTSFLLAWGTEDDVVDATTQSIAFLRALKQAGFFVRTSSCKGLRTSGVLIPLMSLEALRDSSRPACSAFFKDDCDSPEKC